MLCSYEDIMKYLLNIFKLFFKLLNGSNKYYNSNENMNGINLPTIIFAQIRKGSDAVIGEEMINH